MKLLEDVLKYVRSIQTHMYVLSYASVGLPKCDSKSYYASLDL